ncbi:unnamed protein product [Candidula unifasciata]|uniref:Tetraspanin n=1 Tax=Candidula unifasciata TaxID=100452 RepID=A0A8S3YXD0_9EUPU|nr:unnamed protein product [Candidula unifasciata]
MGVISIIGKIVLVLVNILILLLSIAMIICGIIVVAGKDIYNSLLDKFRTTLEEALNNIGVSVDTSNLTFTDIMLPLAYGVIALGVIMGALALLGCIGGCYTLKLVLIVYAIVLLAFFLVQVAIVIVVYADKSAFDGTVKPRIKETLDTFSDVEGTDPKTMVWNAIMAYEGCCGVDSYEDFKNLKHWPPQQIKNKTVHLITPVMCCKVKSNNITCAERPDESTNWMNTGCYDKLFDLIVSNSFVITIIAFLFAFQFIVIFFTIWILCTMDNKIDII